MISASLERIWDNSIKIKIPSKSLENLEGVAPLPLFTDTGAIYMSIHVIRRDELIAIYKKIFEMGLSPIEFRVYCHLTYINNQACENEEFDDSQLAAECCVTSEEFELACQQLELLNLISRKDDVITIHEVKAEQPKPVARFIKESFAKDSKRYQSLPLYQASVYVIKSELNGLTKIGMSKTPRRRIKNIVMRHRFDVEILQIIECRNPEILESLLHFEFRDKQVDFAGEKEWFNLSDEDLEKISVVAAQVSLTASEV